MSDAKPIVAHRKGFYHEVKGGKRYWWCRCGRSRTQPFCDGSHVGTEFLPIEFVADQDAEVIFCGCKHSANAPFCDGTHSNLPGGYRLDDPHSAANQRVRMVSAGDSALLRLDAECYVFSTARAPLRMRAGIAYTPVITPSLGARYQSQFYARFEPGASTVLSADGRHTVLFIASGAGDIEISGRRFAVLPRTGFYITPTEAYRIHAQAAMEVFISNGPGSEDLSWRERMPTDFEVAYPQRCARIDPARRHKLAQRHYQLLVNREHGCAVMTQFIGTIPLSKAEPHRHLYEEALIFLTGAGVVWTERTKASVGPGDVLFLPRKQLHAVQCTSPDGFDVVGVIYPGDNPAIDF